MHHKRPGSVWIHRSAHSAPPRSIVEFGEGSPGTAKAYKRKEKKGKGGERVKVAYQQFVFPLPAPNIVGKEIFIQFLSLKIIMSISLNFIC